ncbi:MAG: Rne/Rng family ribonuclease [Actinomycetota bacterium]
MQDANYIAETEHNTEEKEPETPSRSRPRQRRAVIRPAGPPESVAQPFATEADGEAGAGPDRGTAADTGADAGTDTEADTGADSGTDSGVDTGAARGADDAAATEPEPEPESESEPEPEPEPESERESESEPESVAGVAAGDQPLSPTVTATGADQQPANGIPVATFGAPVFIPPEFPTPAPDVTDEEPVEQAETGDDDAEPRGEDASSGDGDETDDSVANRRRRRRGGRGRRKKTTAADGGDEPGSDGDDTDETTAAEPSRPADDATDAGQEDEQATPSGSSRRRRRRKRKTDVEGDEGADDTGTTVVKVREPREAEADGEVTKVTGSTRLEAKKQRRREGRDSGRRRAPVISESEFLARRESVERVMVVRQTGDRTQIAVLEDGVLVEHHVSRATDQPTVGNVYLGKVQNVLPAMEAAFIDIGRGRNAVLYAGEVDWESLGEQDGDKRIEDVLKSGQSVLVQVTKEPSGHKGARLTSQVSLPGRYVVYVPGGATSGISRKLPEAERNRLKKILKQVVPENAGVIIRTAAEGASEEDLTHDVTRLRSQWEDIQKQAATGNAPKLVHGEPDLAIKVVRDLFNEDFTKLVVAGDGVWDTIESYVSDVASGLQDRVEKWEGDGDIFAAYRVDEQIAKALERKVWLPSGGSLVIDRTEAMTVIDVNTGKFTGSGGNLEETVTKNNLEAAEEVVRQLRLRDIGGIIVIDFIDMVLEANRDLVLRRLVECLGRDRTKHQVAEVTSLGLVQMTRKRVGSGLLEVFSEVCEHCNGRGLHVHAEPVATSGGRDDRGGRSGRRERRRRSDKGGEKGSDKGGDKGKASTSAVTAEVTSKLEATATPGEASPADLIRVDPASGAE